MQLHSLTRTRKAHRVLQVIGAVAVSGSALAQGSLPSLYMDVGNLTFGFGVPSNTFAAAAPLPGEWNALDTDLAVGLTSYITPPLVDTSGVTTAVTVEWFSPGLGFLDFEQDEPNTFGDDEALMDDIGYETGPHEFRYTGLPPGLYDVYTYAMAPDDPTFASSVEVIGSLQPVQIVVGDFSAGYQQGVTHALHTVNVAAGQSLVIVVDISNLNNSVNGIQVVPSSSTLGTNYCGPAPMNSGGGSAVMSATGSTLASANTLTLRCTSMATNAFGFFIVSQTQGFVMNPNGSQGNLCVLGSIGRYVGPGQIQNSGTMGEISLLLDLTQTPQPTAFVSVQSGETWNYQAWFRDSVGGMATSNFSDGLEIVFL